MHNHHSHQNKPSQHVHGQSHVNHSKHGHSSHHAHMVADFQKRFWISFVISIPVLVLSPFIRGLLNIEDLTFPGDQYFIFALASFIFIYGGWPFLKGLKNELGKKQPGMMTLVGVAISVAYFYSAAVLLGLAGKQLLWELVTLVDVMLLGHWIEMKSVMGASKALEELAKLMPATAHKITGDGKTVDVPISELKIGDKVLVKPGEKIPVDGSVTEGSSSINEAMLTGETKPIEKNVNSEVIGGSINGEGSISLEIKKVGQDTYLAQIVNLVRKSQATKSKTQNLANQAAMWLTIIALAGGTLTLLAWLLLSNQDIGFALERTIAVIVIACPHALGLAIPLVIAFSTSLSAQNGLLIRNRTAFEQARKIDAVIFDKTGTLTEGKFAVADVISLKKNITREEIIKLAASIESHSEHPIGQAIVKATKDTYQVKNFKAIPGKGAQAKIENKDIKIVSPGYLVENNLTYQSQEINQVMNQGKTVAFIIQDNSVIGAIGLDDVVRSEAKKTIVKLKAMNIKPIMLTGDNIEVAKRVAAELGIEQYFAQVLPDQKSEKIKQVQSQGLTVAMVGDGINDAPALAQADVGIAIGAGTDVAIETADIILVKNNPLDVVATINLAKRTFRKMVQNLWWAAGYNIVALPIAAGVLFSFGIFLTPAVGAIFMSASTVVVAINASLLKTSYARTTSI